jgi:outer membrane receptor protein involved in Fe transport
MIPLVAGAVPVLMARLAAAAQSAMTIAGIVRDATGGIVSGATVIVEVQGAARWLTVTGPDGRFLLSGTAGATMLIVRAPGFAESRVVLNASRAEPLQIVLAPAGVSAAVTVTATRTEQLTADVPAAVTLLDHADLERSAGVVADEVLRQVPAFSLFRRTSSLVSHPTTQGVSLRGIGPSGVSRTLVLLDGVPLNDPFGGWVYWSRVPIEGADRIEIVESPTSSLYGSYAMGGVINIASRAPAPRLFDGRLQYGNHGTPRVEFDAGHVVGRVGFMVAGSALRTDGFPVVAAAERGAVDTNAATRFGNLTGTAEYHASDRVQTFVRAGLFRERRLNGKKSTIDGTPEANDTSWASTSGGARWELPAASELRATVFADDERFHSNFLAVPTAAAPRSVGRMTLDQHVPARSVGAGAQWSRPIGGSQLVTAGGDWRWVEGDSDENALDAVTGTHVTLSRVSGGRQQIAGAFAQDEIAVASAVTVTGAARVDHWRNYDGHNLETLMPSGAPSAANNPSLPDRTDTVVSPRIGAVVRANGRLRLWAGAGSGFRAPTLNELYRQFRVGSTLTLPNSALGPEHLIGYEAGTTLTPGHGVDARATWFDDRVRDPVSNVTIAAAGASVTQQRQNLGRTSVRGLEFDVDYRVGTIWTFSASYLHDRAVVAGNAAQSSLVGNLLPQVPVHRGSLRAVFSAPHAATVTADLLYTGAQFDDDLNSRRLPPYAIVNLTASHAIRRNVELFASIENLFNRTYIVGTFPTTIGSPCLASIGVRVH